MYHTCTIETLFVTAQEKTGAESALGSTSAVQQVEEAFGVPVVSVVGMSHLTEYMASKEDAAGANAQVKSGATRKQSAVGQIDRVAIL